METTKKDKNKQVAVTPEVPETPTFSTVEEENAYLKKQVAELQETITVLEAQVQTQKAAEAAGIPLEQTFEYEGKVYHNAFPKYVSRLTGNTIVTKEMVEQAKLGNETAVKELQYALETLQLFKELPKG
jgi:hypothetical protein